MRVALADDSALFRRGLARLLSAVGVDICIEASDADELLALLPRNVPDVVILDIRMPPTFTEEGIVAAERIRAQFPDVGLLLLSTYIHVDYALRLLSPGPAGIGYLLKDRVDDVETLHSDLKRLMQRESVIDPKIVTRLLTRHDRTRELEVLTDRERDVLRLMAEGRSNAGIGDALFVSVKTVEAHAANLFTKLGVPATALDNRRVLAVLSWLRTADS
jgi:DNA-binding NarL/FixJ family response regulator